ncbi:hypothetical protein HMPREF0666_00050 [Prevotella sp. C561]|uniref:hypothetical protein n=1 Tax=Prevotella sp. C561 TaxID=563031 RepID=UPI0002237652|nr:hypothetical protein [Prevotella sp. C561]EGW48215.1 hypothetical protein HMPREF0666_00050 [Prevotella sp. C561]
MKKIFTLLSLCFVALSTFAQNWVTTPESGQQYYIAVGDKKVGYVTANGNGEKLTAKTATEGDKEKQTWTCTKGADDKWTFTVTVEGETWTMFTLTEAEGKNPRLAAGTDQGEYLKTYTMVDNSDDPSAAFAGIKMVDSEDANSYVNIYSGQRLGNEYGPWANGDSGSKVYFIKASEVEIPTWNFDFNIFQQGDNSTRYFIQFNRPAANNPTYGPTGLNGLTGNKLILSVDKDTLIADSLVKGDVNFRYKVWHITNFDADSKKIVLVNEAGQYIKFVTFETEMPGGNDMYKKNEAGEWVRNGKSGGGKMNGGFIATTDPQELYIFDSNQGSECYSIGDSSDRTTNNFLNTWGNVGWHHFMGKWAVNDINNALKFIPINDILSDEEIAEMDKATGISNVKVQDKQANGYVYTLDGRLVSKSLNGLAKGLYIVNGKKVVVK